MRLTVLRVLVSLVTLLLLFVAYVGYHLLELNYLLFGGSDAGAHIQAWQDRNADGHKNEDEPPLEGVCVWAGYSLIEAEEYVYHAFSTWDVICDRELHRTDQNGEWTAFFPGGTCNEIRIVAMVPEGYRATTSIGARGCSAQFGFAEQRGAVNDSQVSAEEYLKQQRNIDRTVRIAKVIAVIVVVFVVSAAVVRPEGPAKQQG